MKYCRDAAKHLYYGPGAVRARARVTPIRMFESDRPTSGPLGQPRDEPFRSSPPDYWRRMEHMRIKKPTIVTDVF